MLILSLAVIAAIAVGQTSAATCDTIATLQAPWSTGQNGQLDFTVPATVTSWTVVMTFDKAVTSLQAWTGIVSGSGCTSGGTVCSFINQVAFEAIELFTGNGYASWH